MVAGCGMVDIWSPEKRSDVMARITGSDTGPEKQVRSLLHAHGYRFTVHGPRNRGLPGKPDIVLPALRVVVLVHGCFWHGHEGCADFRWPKTRRAWWKQKIHGNRERDARVEDALRALGWHVVTIWACAVKTREARAWLAARLPGLLGPPPARRRPTTTLPLVAEEPPTWG